MVESSTPLKVEISRKTVIFTIASLIGIWFLVQIREIIVVIFLSIILLSALLKPVEWLAKHRIPRVISVLIVYLVVIGTIATSIGVLLQPFIQQTQGFTSKLPQIIASINDFFIFHDIPVEDISKIIAGQVEQVAKDIFKVTTTIFSSILRFLTIFVLAFYLLLEWDKFVRYIASPFSGKQEKKVINLISKIERGLGHWLRGQIALSLLVGILVFIGLTALGIPFALPLALIAAVLEIIPIIGPTVASIPAILVGLSINPVLGLAVVALYIIIQQVESNFLAPIIMSKVVGLQPPIVIVALLIGSQIAGIAGAILAIPFLVLARIVVLELIFEDHKLDKPTVERE